MEQVEVNFNQQEKSYLFEGEEEIDLVKFSSNLMRSVYQLICSANNKQAATNISKTIFQYFPQLLELSASPSHRSSVCAKIIIAGQTIVECLNCRVDHTCVICLNCYKNGNHEGHKVLFKKAGGGCCDCGDAEAWNPQGFCKEHSGEVQDIDIQKEDVKKFSAVLQDLFYIYYRLKLRKDNIASQATAFNAITNIFERIIEQGPKGIKLLALFLQDSLPNHLMFNQSLQNQSIIFHLFNWSFTGKNLKVWDRILIKMFPYYEFKKVLLATYIECFPILYTCQESSSAGQSISCQILTSYKIVEDYIDNPNSHPIGYNIGNITRTQHMNCLAQMLCSDLDKIFKLQNPVPEKYMKLQIQKGIDILFSSHTLVVRLRKMEINAVESLNKKHQQKIKARKKKKKMQENQQSMRAFFNPIFFMIRRIQQIFHEHTQLQLLISMLSVIRKDRLALMKILKQFAQLIDSDPQDLLILRPYDRGFTLTLFTLCNYNLNILLQKNFKMEFIEFLQKTEHEFEGWLSKLQNRMLQTYFFYSHILCNEDKGYHSSFFNYISIYRGKDKLLLSIDTLHLKMIALLRKSYPTLNFQKLLKFENFSEQKWSPFIFTTFYQEMQMLYIGNFAQIYVGCYEVEDNYGKELMIKEVAKNLAKFIVSEGNIVTLERAQQFCRAFLFDNTEYLKKCLLQCCTYSKERKMFQLKEEFRQQKPFNYHDFQLRLKDDKLTNKNNKQSSPELTYALINDYNQAVFLHYWNESNLQKIEKILLNLYQEAVESNVEDNIINLANSICKLCATLSKFGNPQHKDFVEQILLRINFSSQVKQKLTFYKDLIGGESQEPQSNSTKIPLKKELLMLKKKKKMEQIRKKNQENMLTLKEIHSLQEQKYEAEQFCTICKKKDSPKHQLVYLANLRIRNLQKLAGIEEGVQTPSFTCCYHIFDYQCIEKQSQSEYEAILRCPICRKIGNIFVPAYPISDQQNSRPFVQSFIQRVTQVMMMIHNYQEIDPVEQLFKSFYHYVLLAQFQEQYVRKCRLKLYRTILEMYSHFSISITQLVTNFIRNQITLNPKLLKKDRVAIIDLKGGQRMLLEDEDDSDYEDDQDLSQQLIMVDLLSKHINQTKRKSANQKRKKSQFSPTFMYVGLRILKFIFSGFESIKKEKMATQQSIDHFDNQNDDVKEALNSCLEPQVSADIQFIVDELLGITESPIKRLMNPLSLKFIQLPYTFSWDISKSFCDICHQDCHDLFVCLLCSWKGCLNCQKGGLSNHYSIAHGELSAFLRINEGIIYIVGTKMIKKVDNLYLNEWGEPLQLKKDWNSYLLQQDVLEKAHSLLLRDE